MARYTGPRDKISRRFGVPIFGPSKYLERKNYPPGTHGPRARRKHTDYALALMEKQKLRFHYGLMEKQFRAIYDKARRHRGVTGEIMLQLLECRLDNVVYRSGFGSTRAESRQLVNHKNIEVNGNLINIPSYQVQATDKISVRNKSKDQIRIQFALSVAETRNSSDWVDVDSKNLVATYLRVPERSELPKEINESLIVELYSK